jgi:hypothetical protein
VAAVYRGDDAPAFAAAGEPTGEQERWLVGVTDAPTPPPTSIPTAVPSTTSAPTITAAPTGPPTPLPTCSALGSNKDGSCKVATGISSALAWLKADAALIEAVLMMVGFGLAGILLGKGDQWMEQVRAVAG